MSEQNTEKSKTPYIIGVIILAVVGWYIWGGSDTCTLADDENHVCAESKVHGCEAHECDATVHGCDAHECDAAVAGCDGYVAPVVPVAPVEPVAPEAPEAPDAPDADADAAGDGS